MKICDLTQFYSPVSGGVKRYLGEKVAYLHRRTEADQHVLIIPGERDEVVKEGRSTTYSIRSPLIARTSRYRALLRLQAVEHILEDENPDIIESGDPYQMAWKAIASGEALRIPVVGFYHSHFPEAYLRSTAKFFGSTVTEFVMDLSRRYVRTLYNRFARTLVPSPALGELIGAWGVDNVVNIDLGVDISTFNDEPEDKEQTRVRLGIPTEKIVLLYVGRLAPEKNTKTLFGAFELLNERRPGEYHLLITGDGTQRSVLRNLERRTGGVTWQPYCSDSRELAQLYRAADLFVHPGVQETFGLVTLESQACGTPVIGIRGSYMDRIILTDQRGWARVNSPEALARAILRAGRPAREQARALSARVAERYSWDRVFDRLFSIYRQVVAEGPRVS